MMVGFGLNQTIKKKLKNNFEEVFCWLLDVLAEFNTLNPSFAGSDETRFIYPPDVLTDNSECQKQFSPSTTPRTIMVHRSTQTEETSASHVQSSLLCPSGPILTPCRSPVPQRKRVCANKTPNTLNLAEENKPTYREALEKVIGVSAGF